jgi:hypothetical protein
VSELEDQIRALAAGSLSLAVARYLHDHPEARARVNPVWIDTGVEAWIGRPTEEIEHEAEHRLHVLEEWERDAQELDPDLWESRRADALHALTNLQSARSGAFGTAAGSLAAFLREAGARPDTLDLF